MPDTYLIFSSTQNWNQSIPVAPGELCSGAEAWLCPSPQRCCGLCYSCSWNTDPGNTLWQNMVSKGDLKSQTYLHCSFLIVLNIYLFPFSVISENLSLKDMLTFCFTLCPSFAIRLLHITIKKQDHWMAAKKSFLFFLLLE